MRIWNKKALKTLVLPGAVLLLCLASLDFLGWLTLALPALKFLYYCVLIGSILLSWRFHSSRVFLSILVLFVAQQAVAAAGTQPAGSTIPLIAFLLAIDFVVIAVSTERGFRVESTAPIGLLLFVESVIVFVFFRAAEQTRQVANHAHHAASAGQLPAFSLISLGIAGTIVLVRFSLTRKPVDSALFWSLVASFCALRLAGDTRSSTAYWATGMCILASSIIENSYLLAYHDELTTLPSRRAFNDALARLNVPYCIAVVDIDHFKRFNDTYGHDVGDQVLQLVAGNLGRVTGGGRAYRCGGEEFTILFPGKKLSEVMDHLEDLRRAIESSEFHMRGGDRRKTPRGPDRRSDARKGRRRKAEAIRELIQKESTTPISVTASIGVAAATRKDADPEFVLRAADKALYRAKAGGRNRVEAASGLSRSPVKTAGIA